MKLKTNRHKRITAITTSAFAFLLLFAACQPTPETEIVQSKDDGELEAAIASTSQQTHEITGSDVDVWEETILNSDGETFIEINATIIMPEAEMLPVVSIKPTGFTQEQVDNFIQYFSAVESAFSSEEVMTQEDILEIMINIEAEYAMFKNGDEVFDSEVTDQYFDGMLTEYQNMLAEAPAQSELAISGTELILNDDTGREELEIKIDVGAQDLARLTVLNRNQHSYDSTISLSNGNRYVPDNDLYGRDAEGAEITLAQAQSLAEATLAGLGLTDYSVVDVMTSDLYGRNQEQGYIAICTPLINNVAVVYSDMTTIEDPNIIEDPDGSGAMMYADTGEIVEWVPRRFDECYIEMSIDDTGITYLSWSNVYETISVENENVEILDFEEIKEVFIQQMENNFIYDNHENGTVYIVDRIELGLATIPQRNENGYFYLVPAWTFYGSIKQSENENTIYYDEVYTKYSSHLTINAIDGSLITD